MVYTQLLRAGRGSIEGSPPSLALGFVVLRDLTVLPGQSIMFLLFSFYPQFKKLFPGRKNDSVLW